MGTIRKRGKSWYAEVHVHGERKGKSHPTKQDAMAWVIQTERAAASGQSLRDHKVSELFQKYAEEVSPSKASDNWEASRLTFYGRMAPFTGLVSQVTTSALDTWKRSRLEEVSGETLLRDIALLSNVWRYASDIWGWADRNPFSKLVRPQGGQPRNRRLLPGEMERLIEVAGTDYGLIKGRVIAAFQFSVETAMRGGEICAMARADVGEKTVRIPGTVSGAMKSAERSVPLSPAARAILGDVMALGFDPVFGLTSSQKDANFRDLRSQAGIKGLNFHDARAEAITRLSRKVPILTLARITGHKDVRMLQVYYRESAEDIADRL